MSFRPRAGISVFRIGLAYCLKVPLFTKEGLKEVRYYVIPLSPPLKKGEVIVVTFQK